MRNFLITITRNLVSLFGTGVTTASLILMLTLFAPILVFLVLPVVFVVGLFLTPIRAEIEARRARRAAPRGEGPPSFPVIDLN